VGCLGLWGTQRVTLFSCSSTSVPPRGEKDDSFHLHQTARAAFATNASQPTTSLTRFCSPVAEAVLLFPGKTSNTAPVPGPSCAPIGTLSPPPATTLPSHLRTPSPGLHKFAPLSFSPEADIDIEPEEEEIEEEDDDREVEYAGPSAADFGACFARFSWTREELTRQLFLFTDEPFEPEFLLPDFKTAGFGASLRAVPFMGIEDHEAWERQDEEDRKAFKADLDEEAVNPNYGTLLSYIAHHLC
jgi:hypothetical protein